MADLTAEAMQKIKELQEANSELTEALEPLYTLIGRNYYEKLENYEEEIARAVDRLDSMKQKIHENYLETLVLQGIRLCPNCESEVEQEAVFCGECGTRMEPVEEPDEESIICERCGAKNKKIKKFCIICGQRLDAITIKLEGGMICPSSGKRAGQLCNEGTSGCLDDKETPPIKEAGELDKSAAEKTGENTAWQNFTQNKAIAGEEAAITIEAGEAGQCCPICGTHLPWDAVFCSECGTKIVPQRDPLVCPYCNTQLSFDAIYCPECGRQVQP